MARIYLAARYSRRDELNRYRVTLEAGGHTITSRWLDGSHELDRSGLSVQAADADRHRFALEDWSDVMAAEWVLSFTEPPRSKPSRGGRHVEFGAAVAAGKKCTVIGPRENVFHHLREVEWFPDWHAFAAHYGIAYAAAHDVG